MARKLAALRRKRKLSHSAPLWYRISLYAAMWPKPELIEYRLCFQRRYIRKIQKEGKWGAFRYCLTETMYLFPAIGRRIAGVFALKRVATTVWKIIS
jgi:hypothetical protein